MIKVVHRHEARNIKTGTESEDEYRYVAEESELSEAESEEEGVEKITTSQLPRDASHLHLHSCQPF